MASSDGIRRQLSQLVPPAANHTAVRSYDRTQTHADLAQLPVPLAWSRRLSRSLPELRDVHLVTDLAALAEESRASSSEDEDTPEAHSLPSDRRSLPWFKRYDFVFSCFTQALNIETIWRFPFYCYVCGGGGFLVGCVVALGLSGAPLVCADLAVGQLTQAGPARAFSQLCPLLRGLGLSSLAALFALSAAYSVLTTYFVPYLFHSFYSTPSFLVCNNNWNTPLCRDVFGPPQPNTTGLAAAANHTSAPEEFIYHKLLEASSDYTHLGELRVYLVLWAAFLWLFVFFALRKFSHFTSNFIIYIVGLSYVMFIILLIRVLTLKGALKGLRYLFQTDWTMLADPKLWLYSLAQVLLSLGSCIGTTLTLGSRCRQDNNLLRDTRVLIVFNVLALLLVGCVCFGTLGYLAEVSQQPIESVAKKDPAFVFLIFSVLIGTLPFPSLWGVIFYTLCLCLGIKYQFRVMGTLVLSLEETYNRTIKTWFMGHSIFLMAMCAGAFALSLPLMTQAGLHLIHVTDRYISVLGVASLSVMVSLTVGWLYGGRRLSTDVQRMTGYLPSFYIRWAWQLGLPALGAGGVIIWAFVHGLPEVSAWGLGAPCLAFVFTWVPWFLARVYLASPKSHPAERLLAALQPHFAPKSKPCVPILYIRTPVPFTEDFTGDPIPQLMSSRV